MKIADADTDIDEYEARIHRTGCYQENEALQMCYGREKDWRRCREELEEFKNCYRKHNTTSSSENGPQSMKKGNGWVFSSILIILTQILLLNQDPNFNRFLDCFYSFECTTILVSSKAIRLRIRVWESKISSRIDCISLTRSVVSPPLTAVILFEEYLGWADSVVSWSVA